MNLADPAATQILVDLLAAGLSAQFVVTGASMRPFLAGGETVTLRRVHPAELRCGDLVLCRQRGLAGSRLLLHRVVHIRRQPGQPLVVQTQGDACRAPDPPVTEDAVLGRVSSVHTAEPGVSYFRLDGRSRQIQARVIALRQRAGWQVHQMRAALCMRRRCVRLLARLPGFPRRQSSTVTGQQAGLPQDKAVPVPVAPAARLERLLVLGLRAVGTGLPGRSTCAGEQRSGGVGGVAPYRRRRRRCAAALRRARRP
ncbi:MAG: hypothetical protein IPK16_06380 [Anaerolineales bacterium]|nr:hypothetical protein [Anaerolineales bacterium]